MLELDIRAVKLLFFPRRDLNPHHWYTAAPFAYPYVQRPRPLDHIPFLKDIFFNICVKHVEVRGVYLSCASLQCVLLTSVTILGPLDKELYKMSKFKIQFFQPSVWIYYWLFKNVEMSTLLFYIYYLKYTQIFFPFKIQKMIGNVFENI